MRVLHNELESIIGLMNRLNDWTAPGLSVDVRIIDPNGDCLGELKLNGDEGYVYLTDAAGSDG